MIPYRAGIFFKTNQDFITIVTGKGYTEIILFSNLSVKWNWKYYHYARTKKDRNVKKDGKDRQ